jgi:hypothetical protein
LNASGRRRLLAVEEMGLVVPQAVLLRSTRRIP